MTQDWTTLTVKEAHAELYRMYNETASMNTSPAMNMTTSLVDKLRGINTQKKQNETNTLRE